jgi:hypothetical protein
LALGFGCRTKAEALPGSAASSAVAAPKRFPLAELRAQLKTSVAAQTARFEAPQPPAGVLDKVYCDAPLGKNVAYVSPVKVGAKRPAIVWIAGGMDWGIGSEVWQRTPTSNAS